METKKTKKADLQSKRGIFLEVGLIGALLLAIGAFSIGQAEMTLDQMSASGVVPEEEFIPISREEVRPPEAIKLVQPSVDIIRVITNDQKVVVDPSVFSPELLPNIEIVIRPAGGKEETAVEEEVIIAEQMPMFQGGSVAAFRSWVMGQIRYPQPAVDNGIQGRVTVTFVVEKDGSLSHIAILASPDPLLSQEALRVIASSPEWTPGMQGGRLVRVRYNLPVDFRLGN